MRDSMAVTLRTAAALGAVALTLATAGCATVSTDARSGSPLTRSASAFPSDVIFDYQLGGGYDPAAFVGGVIRDSTDSPAQGRYSICYVNGFQSQPADRDTWLAEPDLILVDESGDPIIDQNWPDELIFNASTEERRVRIAEIVGVSITQCADEGFDAVEIDNLDSYTRSQDHLTIDDALALASHYADRAHEAGLLIGQKNSGEIGARGRNEVGFDFAIAEECHRFNECSIYTDVYGEAVLDIEYTDDLRGTFTEVCNDPQRPLSTILRDRDLAPAGDPSHVFEACDE